MPSYDIGPVYSGLNRPIPTTPSRSLGGVATLPTATSRPTSIYSTAPQAGGSSSWQQTNEFLKSPLGQLAVGGVATGINNYVSSKNRDEDQEAAAAENAAQRALQEKLAQNTLLANMSNSLMADQRDRSAAAVRPLGDASQFATTAAKRTAIADLLGGPQLSSGINYVPKANLTSISPDALGRIRSANSGEAVASGLARQDLDLSRVDPGRTSTLGQEASTLTGLQPSNPFLASLLRTSAQNQLSAQDELDETQSFARQTLRNAIDGGSQPVVTNSQAQGSGGSSAVRPFRHSRVR
jgi:hypothetical protein